jgi:hypothetical protein
MTESKLKEVINSKTGPWLMMTFLKNLENPEIRICADHILDWLGN